MYNLNLIKYLVQHGYRQKLICIITGYNQSYISKNSNNPRLFIPTLDTANQNQLRRKLVVDKILECKPLKKTENIYFDQQDQIYIKLLDFCLVDRDQIRILYASVSQYKISKAFRLEKEVLKEFNPIGIDISQEDYQLFLEQIFKK